MGNAGNLRVLLCHPLCSVYHHNHHICPVNGCHSTDNAVTLQFFFDLVFPAKTCRINKSVFFPIVLYQGINGISGSAGDVGNNHAVLSQNFINQGRFSHIGFSHYGNFRNVALLFLSCVFIKMGHYFFQHISQPQHGSCGNRHRFSNTQIIKFISIHHKLLKTVHFVDN